MDGPFGVPGRTRRGEESTCLLTLLVESTAERVRFSYNLNEHDCEDVKQNIYLHVLNNWKHWRPAACPIGAALRVMVGQGCSRAVAVLKTKGDLRIVLASDTASEQGQDFLSWVPLVGIDGDAGWTPHTGTEIDVPNTPIGKELKCSLPTRKTSYVQCFLDFDI